MFYLQIPKRIHFFSGVIIELKMMVSDLNHLLGRDKTSDLVQNGRDTSPDVVGGLTLAYECSIAVISRWGHPENTRLGSFGPLEASRGQTKQIMVGVEVVYGILEQVGSVQQAKSRSEEHTSELQSRV